MYGKFKNINGKALRSELSVDQATDSNDAAIFENFGRYMKGRLDLEEVKNDPALLTTMSTVKEMMSDYNSKISGNRENEKFIKKIFTESESENKISSEIKIIKQEIDQKNLDLVTAEWVKEWHEKKQKIGIRDPKSEEIRSFITEAINTPVSEPEQIASYGRKKSSVRSLFAKYASLSAAALIGVFFLIRTLIPSSNPENIYKTYYKPFDAISPVTRSINNNTPDNYSAAIASYKSGDWQAAEAGFSAVIKNDPSIRSARFFLGLSELALNHYSQSIDLLSEVATESGEYGKEARWYLGLSYLKINNKQKASECFDFLSKSGGFYKDRSELILRRLK